MPSFHFLTIDVLYTPMYVVLPYLLIILQLILAVFIWVKPNKLLTVSGSAIVGAGCLYLTNFMFSTPWMLTPKVLLYFIVGAVQVSYVAMVLFRRDDVWCIASLSQPLMLPFLVVAHGLSALHSGQVLLVEALSLQWHVVSATLAYALLSLSAFYAFAIITRQAYLKAHARSSFVNGLPSLDVLDKAQLNTLKLALGALFVSVIAGGFYTHESQGVWFLLEGKTILSFVTLVLLVALLAGKRICGIRGRQGAKLVLLLYFFVITLFGISLYL
mgnify:CR=1 FL=1